MKSKFFRIKYIYTYIFVCNEIKLLHPMQSIKSLIVTILRKVCGILTNKPEKLKSSNFRIFAFLPEWSEKDLSNFHSTTMKLQNRYGCLKHTYLELQH